MTKLKKIRATHHMVYSISLRNDSLGSILGDYLNSCKCSSNFSNGDGLFHEVSTGGCYPKLTISSLDMRQTEVNGKPAEKQTWPFFFLTSRLTKPFLSEPRIGKMRKHRLLLSLGLNFLIVTPPPDIT